MTSLKAARQAVDQMGRIDAQIARLEAKRDPLRDKVIEFCKINKRKAIEGNLFRGTVSRYTKNVLDKQAVVKKLGAQWVKNHSTSTKVVKVDIKHRNNRNVK